MEPVWEAVKAVDAVMSILRAHRVYEEDEMQNRGTINRKQIVLKRIRSKPASRSGVKKVGEGGGSVQRVHKVP